MADKDKERMRTVGYVDDLNQLGSIKAELEASKEYAPLKAEGGQELGEVQEKLSDMKQNLKMDISEEQPYCWQEI